MFNIFCNNIKNALKRFCCFMDWHGTITNTGFDGCSITGVCGWCGKSGLYDSNGNFFSINNGENNGKRE
jgi:hypothetical protein